MNSYIIVLNILQISFGAYLQMGGLNTNNDLTAKVLAKYGNNIAIKRNNAVSEEKKNISIAFNNDSTTFTSTEKGNLSVFSQEKMVNAMRISAQKGSAMVSERIAELTGLLPFTDSDNNGNIKANLKINITDKNGFMDYGTEDLSLKLDGNVSVKKEVFFNSLKKLEGKPIKRSTLADVDIGKVSFDAKDKSYKIQLKIDGLAFLNDNINLVVKADKNKNLVMDVEEKWLPGLVASDNDILKEARDAVAKELKKANFGLNSYIKDDKLYFLPQAHEQNIKLNNKESLKIDKNNMDFNNVDFEIDKNGDINVELKNVSVTGSNIGKDQHGNLIPEISAGDADTVDLEVSADINTKGNKEIIIKNGKVFTALDSKESDAFKIEGTSIGRHFNDTRVQVNDLTGKITVDQKNKVISTLGAKVAVALNRPNKSIGLDGHLAAKFNSSGDFQIASKDLSISHPNGKNLVNEFLVADEKGKLQLHIKEDNTILPPVKEKVTKNDLKVLVGAQNYIDSLFKNIDKAKESINVESYLYSGNVATDLTDKLLAKAAGITMSSNYKVKIDNPEGVKVKVIFDCTTGDRTEDEHESNILIKERVNKFINEVKHGSGKYAMLTPEQKSLIINNVNKNMKWKMLEGGVTEIDHRKEVIIDGQNAFSGGGVNFTDSALRKHDMMVEVWGPAVSQIQAEFIQNWEEVAGAIPDNEKSKLLKDEKTLNKIMKGHQAETGHKHTSNTQVLVTDDNQMDVYQKMSDLLKTSKVINIEHAYFTDKELVSQVADAIRRGATVNVIVPEESDEGDKLNYGNIGTLQTLKRASEEPGAKGKFNAYLFRKDVKFNHSKAMSFDVKTAIVGSTNLTSRSLHGTITGFLFNKEMSLMVDDKEFVRDLNKDLFNRDMTPQYSKKLDDKWFKEIEKEQDKIDKYSAIQPMF